MEKVVVSALDAEYLKIIRENVRFFLRYAAENYAHSSGKLLDIAPQVHEGARPFFSSNILVETLDIDPNAGCTYTGDICKRNEFLEAESFDYVVCTEVLEHTLQPFSAVEEIWRILKPGGFVFISTPYNFRIHGPLPDCWRFTEHGLRALLTNYNILEINQVNTPERPLMPIHYTVIAQRPTGLSN